MKSVFSGIIFSFGLCCVFLFFAACSSQNDLKATKNFESEVELQQNLEFTLNKDVVPDSIVTRWDSTEYMEFSPKVKGMFKWNGSSLLVFSPAQVFMPGTEYSVKLTKNVLKYSKKRYGVNTTPILFYTAPLKVTNTNLSWTRGKNLTDIVVQMDMSFNYEVNLNEAAAKLKISYNGNPVNILASNTGSGKVLSIQFAPLNDKDEETAVKISLDKGIPVANTKYQTVRDTSLTQTIPSRYNLTITNVSAQHTGTQGVITVNTSQPVVEKDLKKMIALNFLPADIPVPIDVSLNETGFTVTGAQISATENYSLKISSNLEGAFGGKMKSDYMENITFAKLKPSISFVNAKGMFLSSAGYKNIALNIVNVPSLEVTVIKIYENNLEHFMHSGTGWDYHYDEKTEESNSYEYFNTGQYGDTIFHKNYETNKLPKQSSASILKLDFEDKIKDYNGIYVVRVKSREHQWIQQSKIISISDIGLIVKEENDNVYVFANSIKSATPLSDVKITFVSTNNQNIYTATTDAEGFASFKNISSKPPGFKVGMVTAKKGDDFNFLLFDKTGIATSRFDVGGRRPNATGLIAMIYSERNLYRPGETINLSTIIRDEQWKNISDVPVKIKLTMPNGKEFGMQRKILNEQGSCEASFTPPPTAMTGNYMVEVFAGNDVLLNSYSISVEEFMPDRMKVDLKLDKPEYKTGENITATIQADNLFGTPAAGRNYSCQLDIVKSVFSSDKYEDFDFSLKNEFKFNTDIKEGKTNEKGNIAQVFNASSVQPNSGMLKGNVMATVFDETGRPVHRYGHFVIYTQPVFAGIKCSDEYVTYRVPVKMGLIALDKNSVPQSAELQIVIVKREWHTVIQSTYGHNYRYVSQPEDRVILQQKMKIGGENTVYSFTPQQSGEYEVRIFVNGSTNYVVKRLYAYGWGDTQYTSFEVNNEGNVEIKTDKKSYSSGDNINLLFTTPFEGRMLVTVERDHLMKHYYLNTKNKSASLSVKSNEDFIPNMYVTATLIRPMDGGDMPLTVAHGFKSVTVSNPSYEMQVKINAVEKSRSQTKQTIEVKTAPNAFVTVAVVDEGILQVKNFISPDPYGYFYQKVALSVNAYDMYPWLLPEIKTTVSSTGGDGSESGSGRLSPMFVNRVKNVRFWSGIRQADGSGNLKYDIDITQFSGDLRIMALAYKNKSFGSGEKHMKVADPIVISTALPRFLSPKDEVVMPISISNTTNKSTSAIITVKTTGQLKTNGEETQTIDIPANKEQRVVFNITALTAIGAGKVTVTVRALGETFTNTTDIGIRPPASLQKITGSGNATANNSTTIVLKNSLVPSSIAGKLVISKSPLAQFGKHLDELVRYPYGCVEQTVSAAFPQLYFADLVKSMNSLTSSELNPAYNVQQAIIKLQTMQLGDGGLSYWPQGGEESWWGSVYACNFLIEARKQGFDVNAHTIERLEEYLKYKLNKKETLTFFYNGNLQKVVTPEEVPYSLYVLALAGQSQQSSMNFYKAHQELLTLDGKYLLSAAYALSGQPAQAKEILPPAFEGEVPNRCFSGSFYSHIRDMALSLNVLLEIDPNHKQVGIMARQLSELLAKERYFNTQENVFSILALGKLAKIANQTNATANVSDNGKILGTTTGNSLTIDMSTHSNDALAIQVSGTGSYYYFWEVRGITADGSYKEEDNFLRVRRTFFDRSGKEMGNNFKQNDLVVVRLSIETQFDVRVDNVVITDMLPAGFEIENTRLNEMPKMDWIKEQVQPEYKDIRDDRINLFTSVNKRKKDFYYMVRAVSPGTYQLGPVQADAMYDGNYHSYNGAGVIKISEK